MFISLLSMMFEILEPCRVLRLGTSSKKIYVKQTKIMIKIKIKMKKEKKKRANKEKESK